MNQNSADTSPAPAVATDGLPATVTSRGFGPGSFHHFRDKAGPALPSLRPLCATLTRTVPGLIAEVMA
jgi:hypothetical protein